MKTEILGRPSLLLCVGMLVGLSMGFHPWNALILIPLLGWVPGLERKLGIAACCVLGLVLAPRPTPPPGVPDGLFRAEAIVRSLPNLYARSQRCVVQIGPVWALLVAPREPRLAVGQCLSIEGTLAPLPDPYGSWTREEVFARWQALSVTVVRPAPWPHRLAAAWRDSFVAFTDRTLHPSAAAVVQALCFDVRGMLESSDHEAMRRTGTLHLVSASGLHVLLFAMLLRAVFSLLPIPRLVQLALLAGILVFYALATGLEPPIVRSVLMMLLYLAAPYARREPDLLSALSLSAIAILIWRPQELYSIGFQLSFVTVAALGLFLPSFEASEETRQMFGLKRLRHSIVQAGWVSAIATAASAPLLAWAFGSVSFVAILANLLVTGVVPFLMGFSFVLHGLSVLSPSIAAWGMQKGVEPLAGWLLAVVQQLGALPWAATETPPVGTLTLLLLYLFLAMLWRPRVRPA